MSYNNLGCWPFSNAEFIGVRFRVSGVRSTSDYIMLM